MYSDVITVFNSYEDSFKNVTWYPSVIKGVNLLIDKSAIVAKYGAESKDNAILNIHFDTVDKQIMVDGKTYLPPKEWERQTNDKLADSITFAGSTDFDFFMLGEYSTTEPILDDYDNYRNGFFEEMKKQYDYVFAITSVAKYTVIPHFEITGK